MERFDSDELMADDFISEEKLDFLRPLLDFCLSELFSIWRQSHVYQVLVVIESVFTTKTQGASFELFALLWSYLGLLRCFVTNFSL